MILKTYDANTVSHGDGGEVALELGAHGSGSTMRAGDFTPDSADLGFLGLIASRGLVTFALVTNTVFMCLKKISIVVNTL